MQLDARTRDFDRFWTAELSEGVIREGFQNPEA